MKTIHYTYSHGTGVLTEADFNHLRALYEGEVSFADQQVGRLLDEFERLPLIAGEKQRDDRAALTMLDTYKQISWLNTRWHLIRDRQKNTAELYDYHADPLELHDQAARHPDVAAQLLSQLRQRLSDLNFSKP